MARQTKVDFSGFFSAGTGSTGIRPLPSPFCLSSQTTCLPHSSVFRSQGTSSHKEWDMLQTLLHPCLSFLLKENTGPRREVVHSLYSLMSRCAC